MAKSSNKRKNGKVINRKDASVKRMRRQAAYDLKDLVVCCCVDRQELNGDRTNLISRTVVYNRKLKKIVPVSRLQEVALKTERWGWNIFTAVVCRDQTGHVYFTRERDIVTKTEVLLSEMNDYIADTLCDDFNNANPLHVLTMVWYATPYELPETEDLLPLVLEPIWSHNVLGNCLTRYEMENEDLQVLSYITDNFKDFMDWYINQRAIKRDLSVVRKVVVTFGKTGERQVAGELPAWRDAFLKSGLDKLCGVTLPKASVHEFAKMRWEMEMDGSNTARVSTALSGLPKCLWADMSITGQEFTAERLVFNKEKD